MLPLEFTIEGPPVSAQTRNRERLRAWRETVRGAAVAALPDGTTPTGDAVIIVITYYYDGDSPDVDNIIKPIQDALNGIIYNDDSQVVEIKSRKKSINGSYKIRRASSALLMAFSQGNDFIHIRITEAIDPEVLD